MKTVLLVKWKDANMRHKWEWAKQDGYTTMLSAGILVREDKNVIILSVCESEEGKYLEQLTIPKCSVIFRKTLRLKVKAEG
jgi:hypothetical protein